MKFPFGSLAEAMGLSTSRASRTLNIGGSAAKRYREEGMSALVADRLATAAGFHPAEVWPDWFEIDDDIKRRKAEYQRRYRQRPEVKARNRETRRSYYWENRSYELARQSRYDAARRAS